MPHIDYGLPRFALLRFVAGFRALVALLGGIALLSVGVATFPALTGVLLTYSALAVLLMLQAQSGSSRAGWTLWLWIDAAVLTALCRFLSQDSPLSHIVLVVPVVAMSLLAGPLHAFVLAIACAFPIMLSGEWQTRPGSSLPEGLALLALSVGPAATLLSVPPRALRERLRLLDDFKRRSDPRQGLFHHVDVLLQLLGAHFRVDTAVISVQGPEPRTFLRRFDGPAELLDEQTAALWRERRQALRDTAGYLCSAAQSNSVVAVHLEPSADANVQVDPAARHALLDIGPESIALPLMSYGKPLGLVCLTRRADAFTVADLRWLHESMRELLPLLERSDLLEQLQRETAAAERERIGRDLHDSAVQPYLGLKYGLEALWRQARTDNPLAAPIGKLIELTNEELQTLRDVVSGLRKGQDTLASTAFMGSLKRQAIRFEALYGLKVRVDAPDALQLRGSVAKAILLMVNEGLTNVRRHTPATAVTVSLDANRDALILRMRNDHGSEPGSESVRDFAPRSLAERALEIGGSLCVHREPNCTEVMITLPLVAALG